MVRPLPEGNAEMDVVTCILCAGSGWIAASENENEKGGGWYPLKIVPLCAIVLWNSCMQSLWLIRAGRSQGLGWLLQKLDHQMCVFKLLPGGDIEWVGRRKWVSSSFSGLWGRSQRDPSVS